MDYKTLNAMSVADRSEYINGLSEEELENLVNNLIIELSADEAVSSAAYDDGVYYFVFGDGKIFAMPNSSDDLPRGGTAPDVVTGLSPEDKAAVEAIIDKFGSDTIDDLFDGASEELWFNYYERYPEFEDDDMIEYFEYEGDDDFPPMRMSDEEKEEKRKQLSLYKELIAEVEKYKDSFEKTSDFYDKYRRRELTHGYLYYGYEGDFIDLIDNVNDYGEDALEYIKPSELLNFLFNLDTYRIEAGR